MSKKLLIIGGAVLAILIVGGVYLMTLDIPPPVQQVDKELPDERFPQ